MSIVKIAKAAGVSHTTVSRVINNDRNVAPDTVMKVKKAILDLGYTPKPSSLRRGPRRSEDSYFKTGNVAFLANSDSLRVLSQSPVMSEVLHGIEDALSIHGMSMVQGAVGAKRALPPMVTREEVDGLIIWPTLMDIPNETFDVLSRYKIVYVMSGIADRLPGDRVRNDNAAIGRIAADYLLAKGHKVIAHLTPSSLVANAMDSHDAVDGTDTSKQVSIIDRWVVFQALAHRHKAKAYLSIIEQSHFDLLEINHDRDLIIRKALEELFDLKPRPTGLFVTIDALTAKIYPILGSMGIKIGRDVEILSCNQENSLLTGLDPAPKSIDIRPEQIGRRAVEQLRWRIMHPEDDSRITIEIQPKLI